VLVDNPLTLLQEWKGMERRFNCFPILESDTLAKNASSEARKGMKRHLATICRNLPMPPNIAVKRTLLKLTDE